MPLRGMPRDYAGNARYFWTLFAVFIVLAAVVSVQPALGQLAFGSLLLGQLANLIVAVVAGSLAVVRRRGYHRIVVPTLLLVLGTLWSQLRLMGPA